MQYEFTELERRFSNLIRIGVIEAIDFQKARVRVRCGDLLTDWISWLTRKAGKNADWFAPEIGEQVLVLSPDGELTEAVALPALYSDHYPQPEQLAEVQTVRFANGASVTHDQRSHTLTVVSVGRVVIQAANQITVQAPSIVLDSPQTVCKGQLQVEGLLSYQSGLMGSGGGANAAQIQGNLEVKGNVHASGSVLDEGGNSNHHSH